MLHCFLILLALVFCLSLQGCASSKTAQEIAVYMNEAYSLVKEIHNTSLAGVASHQGNILACDTEGNQLVVLSTAGEVLRTIEAGNLSNPTGLAVSGDICYPYLENTLPQNLEEPYC